MKQNKPVYAKTIAPKTDPVFVDDERQPQTVALADEVKRERAQPSTKFTRLPQKLAHSHFYIRNYGVQALKEAFPASAAAGTVSAYFPFAEGGPLYVDEPRHPYNIEECRKKTVVMRKAGLKYVYLEKDDTLETALQKLEGKI